MQKAYIIAPVKTGGSYKYVNDLVNTFKHIKFIEINNDIMYQKIIFKNSDIVIIQHLFRTNINIDLIISNLNKVYKTIIILHDCHWLTENNINNINITTKSLFGNYLNKNITINNKILQLFSMVNNIICPSLYIYQTYSNYFNTNNFIISEHIDEEIKYNIYAPIIINEINIGMFIDYTEIKGSELVNLLKNKYNKFGKYKISFKIIGFNIPRYKEEDFYKYIIKYRISGLLYLSKYGESYSYALTKYLNTGLPILYNNFGSFKTRINKENCFKVFENENDFYNENILYNRFEYFLNYIVNNQRHSTYKGKQEYNIKIPDFYNNLFSEYYCNKDIIFSSKKVNINTENEYVFIWTSNYNQFLSYINRNLANNIYNIDPISNKLIKI